MGRRKTEPTDKLTLLSGSIASGEFRKHRSRMAPQDPSALQTLDSINPALPSGPQARQPRTAPRGLEAAQRGSGRGSRQLMLSCSRRPRRRCLRSFTTSRPPQRRCPLALAESAPAWEPKVAKLEIKRPALKATASRWAQPLVPSAQRSQAPGELGPGG